VIYIRLFVVFAQIGAISFGGGYSILRAIIHYVVEINKWLTLEQFNEIVAISIHTWSHWNQRSNFCWLQSWWSLRFYCCYSFRYSCSDYFIAYTLPILQKTFRQQNSSKRYIKIKAGCFGNDSFCSIQFCKDFTRNTDSNRFKCFISSNFIDNKDRCCNIAYPIRYHRLYIFQIIML